MLCPGNKTHAVNAFLFVSEELELEMQMTLPL